MKKELDKFTRSYLLDEITRLREAWGTWEFWNDPERASRAMYGLLCVVSRTDDLEDKDLPTLTAVCDEFDKRLAYVLMSKHKSQQVAENIKD